MKVSEMLEYLHILEDEDEPDGVLATIRLKLQAAEELAETVEKYGFNCGAVLAKALENYRNGLPRPPN